MTKWPDIHELTVLWRRRCIYDETFFFSWRTDGLKDEAVRRVGWKVTNDVLDEDTFQPSKSDFYYFVLLTLFSYSVFFCENKWRWCFCMNTHWLAQWVILLPSLNFRIHFCKLAFLHQHHQQQHKNRGIKNWNKLSITRLILLHVWLNSVHLGNTLWPNGFKRSCP